MGKVDRFQLRGQFFASQPFHRLVEKLEPVWRSLAISLRHDFADDGALILDGQAQFRPARHPLHVGPCSYHPATVSGQPGNWVDADGREDFFPVCFRFDDFDFSRLRFTTTINLFFPPYFTLILVCAGPVPVLCRLLAACSDIYRNYI